MWYIKIIVYAISLVLLSLTTISNVNMPDIKKEEVTVSINKDQIRDLIGRVLEDANMYSEDAVELLMLTAATESHLGTYIKQTHGPALGIFQMEPTTLNDICTNYISYRSDLGDDVSNISGVHYPSKLALESNLTYQILMARIHYRRVKEALPSKDNVEGMASYWKRYYNSSKGKGTVEKAVEAYKRYC